MDIRMTREGRKHRVGMARALAAMQDAGVPVSGGGDKLLYVGRDERGVELEIIAVPDDKRPNGMAIIHAMPTYYRDKES